MKKLPLYAGEQRTPVERAGALLYDNLCVRCPAGLTGPSTCLPPTGTGPGGIVVVADQVTQDDSRLGRQCSGTQHKTLAAFVNRHARRPFIFDVAVKCHVGAKVDDAHVEACRPYLWQTLMDAKPDRIIVAGSQAALAVLGRMPHAYSTRRGYGWLWDAPWADPVTLGDGRVVHPVPVFLVMPPWMTHTNSFLRQWWEEDIAWACNTPVPRLPPWDGVVQVVQDVQDARDAERQLTASKWITCDVETSGRMHAGEIEVVSLAFSTADEVSFVWDRAALTDPGCREVALSILADDTVLKLWQNGKFDLQAIHEALGVTVRGLAGDTRIWRKQLDSDSLADLYTLGELVGCGGDAWGVDDLVDQLAKAERLKAQQRKAQIVKRHPEIGEALKGTKDQVEILLSKYDHVLTQDDLKVLWRGYVPKAYVYGDVPDDQLSAYNAADVVITARVANHLEPQLREKDLMFTWDSLWGPATDALSQVETWGFPVDRGKIETLSRYFGAQLNVLRQRFSQYPGFNPSSNDSVADLLFNQLKLKPVKKSEKTGDPSTDHGTLEALKGQHPVIDDLIEWRHIAKLKSQYADGMILHIAPDGCIHTTYNVDGARSGRASSENPNMQNIPSEEKDPVAGKMVKDCFVARPGYVLVASDYAQLEFRVAADLSNDPDMKAVFLSGKDFHQATAEFIAPIVWKIQPHQVTKSHRRGAKTFNFGIMYGMLDAGIAERAGCSLTEAKLIRQAVLGKFRRFAAWVQECLAYTKKTGLAWTYWMGRRAHVRQLYLVKDQNDGKRINAENSAHNTPVQGTSSFYCLASVTALVNWIQRTKFDAKIVATVHDSIVAEVREDLVPAFCHKMRGVMTGWPTATGVPLDIDIKTGLAWGSMVEYELPEVEASGLLGGPEAAAQVVRAQSGVVPLC